MQSSEISLPAAQTQRPKYVLNPISSAFRPGHSPSCRARLARIHPNKSKNNNRYRTISSMHLSEIRGLTVEPLDSLASRHRAS
jgi:hypothetical protein